MMPDPHSPLRRLRFALCVILRPTETVGLKTVRGNTVRALHSFITLAWLQFSQSPCSQKRSNTSISAESSP